MRNPTTKNSSLHQIHCVLFFLYFCNLKHATIFIIFLYYVKLHKNVHYNNYLVNNSNQINSLILIFLQQNLSPKRKATQMREISQKNILISKLVLVCVCFIGLLSILAIKIQSGNFTFQKQALSYTSCETFFKIKYQFLQRIRMVINGLVITACIFQVVLILIYMFDALHVKPTTLESVVNRKLFKVEYVCISITIMCQLCLSFYSFSFFRQSQSCDTGFGQNSLLQLTISMAVFGLKPIVLIINLHLAGKSHSEQDLLPKKDDQGKEQNQLNKQFQKDTKQMYQSLLGKNKNPFQIKQRGGFNVGCRFSQNQKFLQNRPLNKLNRLKKNNHQQNSSPYETNQLEQQDKNIFSQKSQVNQQNQQFPDNTKRINAQTQQYKDKYDRKKVNQYFTGQIQKLEQFGYQKHENPYQQKICLVNNFKIQVQKSKRQLLKDDLYQQIQDEDVQTAQKKPIKPKNITEMDNTMCLVVRMDTSQKKVQQTFFKPDELEPIHLDQIYYREYLLKQKADKQEKRRRNLALKNHEQLRRNMDQRQRARYPQWEYLAQDQTLQKIHGQMRQYASRTAKQDSLQKGKSLHLHIQKTNKCNRKQKQMKQMLCDEIIVRQNILQSLQRQKTNRNRKCSSINLKYGEIYRQRKNPLQAIRGKWAL